MIYLDNSATTFPKPPQVSMAMSRAMTKFGANPGRSGHAMSIAAAEEIFKCREAAASFFHADGPECVVFTLNCTQAINMVLKGYVKPGDHIVTSCLEHNAVSRPLQTMADRMHVTFTEVTVTPVSYTHLDVYKRQTLWILLKKPLVWHMRAGAVQ